MPHGESRIREADLVIPALRLAAEHGGQIKTTDLKEELLLVFEPTGDDAEYLENRSDIKFTQIVRNLVSHRDSPSNFIYNGYAEYVEAIHGIRITEKGRELLRELDDGYREWEAAQEEE